MPVVELDVKEMGAVDVLGKSDSRLVELRDSGYRDREVKILVSFSWRNRLRGWSEASPEAIEDES